MRGRLATAIALAAMAGATPVLAGQAQPGSIASSWEPIRGPGHFGINGGPAGNDIVVGLQDDRYLVRDRAGITAGRNCTPVGPRAVSCMVNSGMGIVLGKGDDRFVLNVHGRYGSIDGDQGHDVLKSGDARNYVRGAAGTDVLIGRGGNDGLDGGVGRDAFFGGTGNDRLDAEDDARDKRIVCGPGRDVALIDPALDPKPLGCEILVRRGHSSD